MFGMRHGKKTECLANLGLLLRGDAVLFRELRGAFDGRRLGRRSTAFGRLSRVNYYPHSELAPQNLPCRVLAMAEVCPVLVGSFVIPFALMTRLHGPTPRKKQARLRTFKFFASSSPPSCQLINATRLPSCPSPHNSLIPTPLRLWNLLIARNLIWHTNLDRRARRE